MFRTTTISTRDLLRRYKRIIHTVKKTKEPAVVVSQHEPQVAIISLDALDTLKHAKDRAASQALVETVERVRLLLKDEQLPADLSARHDHYLWDADAADATDPEQPRQEHPVQLGDDE